MTQLKTNYQIGEIPFPEYPRPQFERKSWVNLNGVWDFAKVKQTQTPSIFQKILVPFSPETESSGISNGFILSAGEKLVYQRAFTISIKENEKTLLHFGAVDSACKVYINDKFAGEHSCGFTAFSFDITTLQ